MTATQKFAAFGLGTCAFYIAISRGLHSFFYVSDSTRQERFERVELEKASHRGQAPVR